MLRIYYVFLLIITGFFTIMLFITKASANLNLECLGILFFLSFVGHMISFIKEMKL